MKKLIALLMALLLLVMNVALAEEAETEPVYQHEGTWSSCGYSIDLYWEEGIEQDEELREVILGIFFDKYPAIRETFGTTDERSVTLYLTIVDQTKIGPDGIFMSYENLKNNNSAKNTLVMLFANKVINGHPNPENDPEISALSLGLQYYAENVYAVYPEEAVWLMPYEEGQQLTDNNQIAAAFITWIAQTYGDDVPVRLNRVLHDGYYITRDFWSCAVGNSLENLWAQYAQQSSAQ